MFSKSLNLGETKGFIWLNWRWLPSLIYCSIPKADTLLGSCEHRRRQPPRRFKFPGTELPLHWAPRQRKIPASFSWSSGFVEPGKEVNSKGRKWPRGHNNMWKAKTGASVTLFQTILICGPSPGSLTHYQMEICFQMPLGICHSRLVTFAHFRRQTCADIFKLPERCSPRKVLGSLADSTNHLTRFFGCWPPAWNTSTPCLFLKICRIWNQNAPYCQKRLAPLPAARLS